MIRHALKIGVCLQVMVIVVGLTQPAAAEWFFDLFGGVAATEETNVTATISGLVVEENAAQSVNFDDGATFGIRGGYWFEEPPHLGISADMSYFKAEGDDVDIDLFGISFLLMARWPLLRDDEYPRGRLHPYAGLGPAVFTA